MSNEHKLLPWQSESRKTNRINKAISNPEIINGIDKMYSEKFLDRPFKECITGNHQECEASVSGITTRNCTCECHNA